MFDTIFQVITLLFRVVSYAVIIQFIFSLLLAFNVLNQHNRGVEAIWKALNAILDPILKPIRRRMPNTGAIDLSPMVLLISMQIILIVLDPLRTIA